MIRKRLIQNGLIFAVSLWMVFSGSPVQSAVFPDYQINDYKIEVTLMPDGSANVVETLSCQFNRDMRQISFLISYNKNGSGEFQDISIDSLTKVADCDLFIVASRASRKDGQANSATYDLVSGSGKLDINLYSALAAGSRRTIRLTYRLGKAVLLHQDAARLECHFFDSCHGAAINSASLIIMLPGRLLSSVQSWNFPVSLTRFNNIQTEGDRIVFQADSIPANQGLTLVSLLPVSFFSEASSAVYPQDWESLTVAARQMQSDLIRSADRRSQAYSLIFILLGVALVLLVMIYLLFDRDNAAVFKQLFWQEMPANIRPAVLAVLLRQKKVSRLILGTMTDLVRWGKLAMHGCVFERRDPESESASKPEADNGDLTGFEKLTVNWLFDNISKGTTLSTAEIRNFARDLKTAAAFRAFSQFFLKELEREILDNHLIDVVSGQRGKIIGLLASVVYLLAGVMGAIVLKTADALLLFIPAAVFVVYSLQIRRFTVGGREIHAIGHALYRTIQRSEKPGLSLREHFDRDMLPLAICFGHTDRLIKAAAARVKGCQTQSFAIYGYPAQKDESVRIEMLGSDLKAMESMLSASLLLSAGFHG